MSWILIGLVSILLVAIGWIGYKVFGWLNKLKAWK